MDAGNPFLSVQPANLAVSIVNTEAGQFMMLTMRVGNCTLTAFLTKPNVEQWETVIKIEKDKMTSLVFPSDSELNGHSFKILPGVRDSL